MHYRPVESLDEGGAPDLRRYGTEKAGLAGLPGDKQRCRRRHQPVKGGVVAKLVGGLACGISDLDLLPLQAWPEKKMPSNRIGPGGGQGPRLGSAPFRWVHRGPLGAVFVED